jgi:ArsR family transcriptional regulator, zinc-responsive transcriptional repressor
MNNETYHFFFGVLSNPLRVEIVLNLREKEKSVGELANQLHIEQSKISHALAILKQCNIVEVKQKGKSRIYSLNKKTIIPILKIIDKHAQNFCGGNCSLCGRCQ